MDLVLDTGETIDLRKMDSAVAVKLAAEPVTYTKTVEVTIGPATSGTFTFLHSDESAPEDAQGWWIQARNGQNHTTVRLRDLVTDEAEAAAVEAVLSRAHLVLLKAL